MKNCRIALAALAAALLAPVVYAGDLPLSAGFMLAQNADSGGSALPMPGARPKPLADADPAVASGSGARGDFLRGVGDDAIIEVPDGGTAVKPSVATAPEALAPGIGPRHNLADPLAPVPVRRADHHRWQSLVPGAIK
jgi:hypothetical protein